ISMSTTGESGVSAGSVALRLHLRDLPRRVPLPATSCYTRGLQDRSQAADGQRLTPPLAFDSRRAPSRHRGPAAGSGATRSQSSRPTITPQVGASDPTHIALARPNSDRPEVPA